MKKRKIIILKNDATGDLIHSRETIYNIIEEHQDKEVILILSERNKEFNFLFDKKNLILKKYNYHLNVSEKLSLLFFFIKEDIEKVYILAPKNFYFYLPFFFRNIKFYGLCVDDIKGYKRPSNFFRKFLHKKIINNRGAIFKRPSTFNLQNQLIGNLHKKKYKINFLYNKKNQIINSVDKYIYFHLKQEKFNKLGWGTSELISFFDEILKYSQNIFFTRDIENENRNFEFYKIFNVYDFKNNKFINNNSKILLLENAEGPDLYNIIRRSHKVIAFHGMITSFAWIEKKNVLDLYFCEINSWEDYRKYRNSFYEFKPKYEEYDFIIPSRNLNKTLKKMSFFLKKNV